MQVLCLKDRRLIEEEEEKKREKVAGWNGLMREWGREKERWMEDVQHILCNMQKLEGCRGTEQSKDWRDLHIQHNHGAIHLILEVCVCARVLNRTCQRSAWIIEDILYCHSGCLCWCAPCIRHSRALMQHLRFKTMEVLTILRDWDFKVLILWATVMLCNYKIKQCGAKSHLLWLYDPFNSKRKLARVEGKRLKLLVLQVCKLEGRNNSYP